MLFIMCIIRARNNERAVGNVSSSWSTHDVVEEVVEKSRFALRETAVCAERCTAFSVP